jgi:hypothetical protein
MQKGIRIVKVSRNGVYYTFYEIINQIIHEFLYSKSNSMDKIFRISIPERHDEYDYLISGGFTIGKGTSNYRDKTFYVMKSVLTNKIVVRNLIHLKSSRLNLLSQTEKLRKQSLEISERISNDKYATICDCCPKPESLATKFRLG